MCRLVVGLILCLLGSACRDADDAAEGKGKTGQAAVGGRTALATIQPFTQSLGAIGVVAVRPGHVALLSAPAPTRIARVFVALGQHVTKGAALVEFEQAAFQATAQSAEAALAGAERSYERAQRLSQAGIVPRKEVDQAAADLAQARATVVGARRSRDLSTLRAPLSGIVTRMGAVLGASVDANQPLVEVADPRALDVVLSVTPSEAALVRPSAVVTLAAGQGASGEALGGGRVIAVGGAVDSATRTVAVRVLPLSTPRPLRIGETIFGQIAVATRAGALTVPIDALVPDADGFKVFVVDGNGTARARSVVVGGRTPAVAEVTGGLAPGERVVTYGAYGVEDSAKVVPVKP
ncbi:MAG: efflux RND transporter periplasmic adaptor subunit [Gemmatimonadaceae bacterium]